MRCLYFSNLDQYWILEKEQENSTIVLKFNTFQVEDNYACNYDYLDIYDG